MIFVKPMARKWHADCDEHGRVTPANGQTTSTYALDVALQHRDACHTRSVQVVMLMACGNRWSYRKTELVEQFTVKPAGFRSSRAQAEKAARAGF